MWRAANWTGAMQTAQTPRRTKKAPRQTPRRTSRCLNAWRKCWTAKWKACRRSKRLTDSPACLVLGEHDMGAQMRRIMEVTGQSVPDSKPHLEVNLTHPLVTRLDQEPDEDRFNDLVSIVFDQATLAEGNAVAEPGAYVQRINKLLVDLLDA